MKWLVPENDLEREQREFLDSIVNGIGSHVLYGFPGSGKSICMLYSALWIRRRYPDAKILFVEFNHALIKMIKAALAELEFDDVDVITFYKLESYPKERRYDFIICDEVQDIPERALRAMSMRAKRIIVGGDRNQSIYDTVPIWEEAPANETQLIEALKSTGAGLTPAIKHLTVIHRLNKYVIEGISSFNEDMNVMRGQVSMLKKHIKPQIWHCRDAAHEVQLVMKSAGEAYDNNYSAAIILPTHNQVHNFINIYLQQQGVSGFSLKDRDYEAANKFFAENNLPIEILLNQYGNIENNKIKILSYHGSKGLDFERVYLPYCNYNELSNVNKSLYMVAMTRSRDILYISFSRQANEFVMKFLNNPKACQFVDKRFPGTTDLFGKQQLEDDKNSGSINDLGW